MATRMTLFELTKVALDELYAQGRAEFETEAELDAEIKKKLNYLSDSYGNLESAEREHIDYRSPTTRFAYVYTYVAAHSDYLVQVLDGTRSAVGKPLFDARPLRVSCVGGGPGSDIIAVLKYIDENKIEQPTKLTCYLLDGEQAWADTWTEIDDSLRVDVRLKTNFQALDVTKPESWKYQRRFLDADMFTLSYFVSEVYSYNEDGEVSKFFSMLLEQAKKGTLVVYLDNSRESFSQFFDGLWQDRGYQCVWEADSSDWRMRFSEEKSVVENYYKKFKRWPRLTGNAMARVLRKE